MRERIGALGDRAERDFFLAVYASIIRRVSRATTQQGRLFLDAATAEPDPRPRFAAAAKDAIEAVSSLGRNTPDVTVLQASAMDCDFTRWKAPLVICHPPYFNVYKYSGIFSLEMAWLGYEIQAVRRQEIREFFKVGKPEKVAHYVNDLSGTLRNIARALAPGGVLALMMGDTTIHGKRICTTKLVSRLSAMISSRSGLPCGHPASPKPPGRPASGATAMPWGPPLPISFCYCGQSPVDERQGAAVGPGPLRRQDHGKHPPAVPRT